MEIYARGCKGKQAIVSIATGKIFPTKKCFGFQMWWIDGISQQAQWVFSDCAGGVYVYIYTQYSQVCAVNMQERGCMQRRPEGGF